MKKILFIVTFLLAYGVSQAVEVKINSGISSQSVKSEIERNASIFLSEVNKACLENRPTKFKDLNAEKDFKPDFQMLWENMHFKCNQEVYACNAIQTKMGYQIREIIITIVPVDGTELKVQSLTKEGIINFTPDGKMKYFVMADDSHAGASVIAKGEELGDLTRRLQILDYVEQFRTAYNKKDLPFIEQIFSDDALIITGHVAKKYAKSEVVPADMVTYVKQTKEEYVNKLRGVFAGNAYIDVKFDDIKIYRHPNPNYSRYYGVLVTQHWSSSNYSDVGYVFMLWDFENEDSPKIHVRTWEPINVESPFGMDDVEHLTPNK